MILTLADIRRLPLPAALVDEGGTPVAHTPEWEGGGPGVASYGTGAGALLVSPPAHRPELAALASELVDSIRAAQAAVADETSAAAMRVLADGLALVAGRPPVDQGTSEDVRRLAAAALARRTRLELAWSFPAAPAPVRTPGVVALALVQLAANAERYAGCERVEIAVTGGPSFWVRWRSQAPAAAAAEAHRHQALRRRWGLGFVRQAVDALGGSYSGPQDLDSGTVGTHVGLGVHSLRLPLAVFEAGARVRATRSWDEEAGEGRRLELEAVLEGAARASSTIVQRGLHRARAEGGRTYVALAPETSAARAVDTLRGFEHEALLWNAPEPHAATVHALITLLQVALGRPWPLANPLTWRRDLKVAGRRYGLELELRLRGLAAPDPRLLAFLLARMGGSLEEAGEAVLYRPDPRRVEPALAAALGLDRAGAVRIA